MPAEAGIHDFAGCINGKAWMPTFVGMTRNGEGRVSLAAGWYNSITGLEKQPPLPPDLGSIGAKDRSWNWITDAFAGMTGRQRHRAPCLNSAISMTRRTSMPLPCNRPDRHGSGQ